MPLDPADLFEILGDCARIRDIWLLSPLMIPVVDGEVFVAIADERFDETHEGIRHKPHSHVADGS